MRVWSARPTFICGLPHRCNHPAHHHQGYFVVCNRGTQLSENFIKRRAPQLTNIQPLNTSPPSSQLYTGYNPHLRFATQVESVHQHQGICFNIIVWICGTIVQDRSVSKGGLLWRCICLWGVCLSLSLHNDFCSLAPFIKMGTHHTHMEIVVACNSGFGQCAVMCCWQRTPVQCSAAQRWILNLRSTLKLN